MSVREMSFTTTASRPLRVELRAAALDGSLAVLGGEADDASDPAAGAAATPATMSVGRLELERQAARALPARSSRRRRPAGRKSAGAAAMIRTSAPAKRSRTAASSSAVVSTVTLDARRGRERHVGGDERHVGAAAGGLLGEREAHPARRAVADEANRVDRLARAARGDEHAQTVQRPRRVRPPARTSLDDAQDSGRLGEPADSPLPLRREPPAARLHDARAARAQQLQVRLGRRVLVHRGCSSPARAPAARRSPARRSSAGCRPGRPPASPACWPTRARRRTRPPAPPARGGRSGRGRARGRPGKAPRAGSASNSSTRTGAPVTPSNVARPTNSRLAGVWITRTEWPAAVASRTSSTALYAAIPPLTPSRIRAKYAS